jgi:hypothetical protein
MPRVSAGYRAARQLLSGVRPANDGHRSSAARAVRVAASWAWFTPDVPDGIVEPWDHVGCPLLRGAAVVALIRGRLKSQVACACHVKPATMRRMGDPHQNAIAMGTP